MAIAGGGCSITGLLQSIQGAKLFEDIIDLLHHLRAVSNELETTPPAIMEDGPRQGKNFTALLHRGSRGYQRATGQRRLNNQHPQG